MFEKSNAVPKEGSLSDLDIQLLKETFSKIFAQYDENSKN
jgi:hypothetical protein